jgi:hypothetical protein
MSGMNAEELHKHITDSVLPFPKGFYNRVKYVVFGKFIYSFHNIVRDILLFLGILRHEGRQDFHIGHLAPGRRVEDFLKHLEQHQFGNNFVAWKDEGEAVSVRRLADFEWQYHLRIHQDGEVRGHYEYTPESHPILHLKEVSMEPRREDFIAWVGDWVTLA